MPLYNDPRPDRVRIGTRLWDSEVRLAEAIDNTEGLPPREQAYQFSNGRAFRRARPYAGLEPTPMPTPAPSPEPEPDE